MRAVPHLLKFILVGWLALVVMGGLQVTNWATDNYSDRFIFEEMIAVAKGEQSWGISVNTHYPNGPGYMILPFLKLGFTDAKLLRFVPFTFSVLALSFFMFAIYRSRLQPPRKAALIGLWYLLAFLPGFVYWQGALHEHSYAMSLCLVSLGIALWPRNTGGMSWLFACFTTGFTAAWMGFDFLPVQLTAFFAASIAVAGVTLRDVFSRKMVKKPLFQSLAMFCGALAGIFSHLLQNALYFGSWSAAWNDLIGSATTRAGMSDTAARLNPEYYRANVQALTEKGYDNHLWSVFVSYSRSFAVEWASPLWLGLFTIALLVVPAALGRSFQSTVWRATPSALVALISCYLWVALMPNHAVFHLHFLPRHFIVGLLALAIATNFAAEDDSAQVGPESH